MITATVSAIKTFVVAATTTPIPTPTIIPVPTQVIKNVINIIPPSLLPITIPKSEIMQLYGPAAAPLIEKLVMYLRDQWDLPKGIALETAFVVSLLLNIGIAWYLHLDMPTAILAGLSTGFITWRCHELRT